MSTSKRVFLAAALTGALSASPLVAFAGTSNAAGAIAEKSGCNGKKMEGSDKASCHGKAKQGGDKKDKGTDKSACSGKHGCGGKDKSS